MGASQAFVCIGCGLFVGIMVHLHVVRRDVSPLRRGMSRYAGPPTLGLANVAFLALAGAFAALAANLDRPAWLLALQAAAGLVVVAATPIGQPATSPVTALHTIGGLALYAGVLGVMFLSPAPAGDPRLRWSFVAALTVFGAGAFGVPGLRRVVGVLQRVVFVLIIVWLLHQARS
jgi:hypothetical protein